MLAALLLNEVFGVRPGKKRRDDGMVGGKFLMVKGYAIDIKREKKKQSIAKEIVRAVYKIELPKETKAEVETLVPYIYKEGSKEKVNYEALLADYTAYNRLVDILIAHAQEEEEMALIMTMLETM